MSLRAYASVEGEIGEGTMAEKASLVLRYAIANLCLGRNLRGCAAQRRYFVQLRNRYGVLHPVKELLICNDPNYAMLAQP